MSDVKLCPGCNDPSRHMCEEAGATTCLDMMDAWSRGFERGREAEMQANERRGSDRASCDAHGCTAQDVPCPSRFCAPCSELLDDLRAEARRLTPVDVKGVEGDIRASWKWRNQFGDPARNRVILRGMVSVLRMLRSLRPDLMPKGHNPWLLGRRIPCPHCDGSGGIAGGGIADPCPYCVGTIDLGACLLRALGGAK